MRRSNWIPLTAALGGLLLSALPAAAAGRWSLGTNFGYTREQSSGGTDRSNVSVPGSPLSLMPGLRIGFQGESERSEVFFDLGLRMAFGGDRQSTRSQTTLNYQRNFALGKGGSDLYATLGGGLATLFETRLGPGGSALTASRLVGGGGIGVRKRYGQGHGTLRLEGRYDSYTAAKDWDIVLTPAGGVISAKVGFDLWMK